MPGSTARLASRWWLRHWGRNGCVQDSQKRGIKWQARHRECFDRPAMEDYPGPRAGSALQGTNPGGYNWLPE
eukprot:4828134-Prymnesium_polylepis.1